MKKIFYILLAVSITFASCKKEDDEATTAMKLAGLELISIVQLAELAGEFL